MFKLNKFDVGRKTKSICTRKRIIFKCSKIAKFGCKRCAKFVYMLGKSHHVPVYFILNVVGLSKCSFVFYIYCAYFANFTKLFFIFYNVF